MGGGKSQGSSNTQVQLTPEQQQTLQLQNAALRDTFMPAYTSTIGGAKDVYNNVIGVGTNRANNAMDIANQTGTLQQGIGSQAYAGGASGLGSASAYQQALGGNLASQGAAGAGSVASRQGAAGSQLQNQGAAGLAALFDPSYESNQIQAALQAGRESARESQAGQNAMYGAAGGLGSARQALADKNLASLNAQRQATAAAGAQAQVQANKAAAANSLLGAGTTSLGQAGSTYGNLLSSGTGSLSAAQQGYGSLAGLGSSSLGAANQAAASQIGYASTPQDLYSKYASIVFGVPQASTTPNYAGTQGSSQQGKSGSFGFGK